MNLTGLWPAKYFLTILFIGFYAFSKVGSIDILSIENQIKECQQLDFVIKFVSKWLVWTIETL